MTKTRPIKAALVFWPLMPVGILLGLGWAVAERPVRAILAGCFIFCACSTASGQGFIPPPDPPPFDTPEYGEKHV